MLTIDPGVFADASILPETRALNDDIVDKLNALPDMWTVEPAIMRERRKQGLSAFPVAPFVPHAEVREIDGPAGPIPLRIIAPRARASRGVYLHLHGGGWTLGAADQMDPRLERIAENCGLTIVSVDYRLAPEDPYPAGPDDCEAAALWLAGNAASEFGTSCLTIGGESAGAHLSVVTLLRLRDRHGLTPFSGANLVAGSYDLGLSPSVRNWGEEKLILCTRDVEFFSGNFLPPELDRRDPDISPYYARLDQMPPALFTVGTRDILLDETLSMAVRWLAAGNGAELKLHAGGCHVFQAFDCAITETSLAEMDAFLNSVCEAA